MVHFPPLPSLAYEFSERYFGMSQSGFPHSDIPGSKPAYGSPRRIVVRHVLLRLLVPRHPPCALISLTIAPVYSLQKRYIFASITNGNDACASSR